MWEEKVENTKSSEKQWFNDLKDSTDALSTKWTESVVLSETRNILIDIICPSIYPINLNIFRSMTIFKIKKAVVIIEQAF